MTEKEFNKKIFQIRPKLLRFASGFNIEGAATPEDMVQDAISKAWVLFSQKNKINRLDNFLFSILKNLCLDYLKLKKNSSCSLNDINTISDLKQNGSEYQDIKEDANIVKSIIETLPTEQQMIVKLRDMLGYEFKEIAETMKISEGNARVLLSRSRKNIKTLFLKYTINKF